MISQTGKHALHVLGHLAENQGKVISGQEIAATLGVPANYIGKILNMLAKHGFVSSQKGWGGGFMLQQGALKRPISEVLDIVEGPSTANRRDCVFGLGECDDDKPCPMHEHWKPIRKAYEEMLQKLTVEKLSLEKAKKI